MTVIVQVSIPTLVPWDNSNVAVLRPFSPCKGGHSINHNFCDLQLKSLDANQPQTGKSVGLHTKQYIATSVYHFVTETAQLMVESWEVWTYSLISSLGLQ